MPSAANVKIEKSSAMAAGTGSDNGLMENSTPLRQAITIVEHKIRNLEKRKGKLECYRDIQKSGKDLNADQKVAVSKYDEVVQTLEFARDLYKQFLSIAVVSEKDDKKKARKDAIARSQAELTKVREVLLIQDALSNMGQDNVRDDFLNARNGAAQLTQADLKLLDDYYTVVTPKHEAGDPTAFMPQVQAAAEHLLAVVDGKNKEAFGSTYNNIKEVIGKVHESGYLDQAIEEAPVELEVIEQVPVEPTMVEHPPPVLEPPMQHPPMPIIEQPPPPPQLEQPMPPMEQVPPMQPVPPVQPVPPEQAMYYQQPPPPPQQARPITEVIGTGSFFFLQESELDTPPEQIASQTFTNKTFGVQPPPPIPMPSQFHQQYPTTQQQQPPPPQQPPQQVPLPQPTQPTPPPSVPQQMPNPQQIMPTVTAPPNKNGYGDHLPDHQADEIIRHRGNNNRNHQRSNITTHHPAHQTFFANNSSYTNRSNRNRNSNGPRLSNRQNNHQ